MKVRMILVLMLIAAIPLHVDAQTKVKAKATKTVKVMAKVPTATKAEDAKPAEASLKMETAEAHEAKTKLMPPPWSLSQGYMNDRIVYFPDYYVFYTPARGYVFWNNGQWTNSTDLPSFLQQADMRKAHAEILDNTDIDAHPEKEFSWYKELYPPESVDITVPVPYGR